MDNVLIRKIIVCLIYSIVLVLMVAGCEAEEEEFDEKPLIAVNNYVYEMSNALLDDVLLADLEGWSRDYYDEEDDMPFYYDEERREWLEEHLNNLEALRSSHMDEQFPTAGEISDWEVVIVRGDYEWLLEGEAVNAALHKLEEIYNELTGVLKMIEDNDGELDMAQSERVLEILETIKPAVNEVREVFFR